MHAGRWTSPCMTSINNQAGKRMDASGTYLYTAEKPTSHVMHATGRCKDHGRKRCMHLAGTKIMDARGAWDALTDYTTQPVRGNACNIRASKTETFNKQACKFLTGIHIRIDDIRRQIFLRVDCLQADFRSSSFATVHTIHVLHGTLPAWHRQTGNFFSPPMLCQAQTQHSPCQTRLTRSGKIP